MLTEKVLVMSVVTVALCADDPITLSGAQARLQSYPQIRLAGPGEDAAVLLVIAAEVTDVVLNRIRNLVPVAGGGPAVVIVATELRKEQLLVAVGGDPVEDQAGDVNVLAGSRQHALYFPLVHPITPDVGLYRGRDGWTNRPDAPHTGRHGRPARNASAPAAAVD